MHEQGKQRVTVVVADDHPLYREGVVRALLASGSVEIVAEAEDGRSALAEIQDCLLYTSPSPRDGLLSRMPSSA